jgi:hypothetical protein
MRDVALDLQLLARHRCHDAWRCYGAAVIKRRSSCWAWELARLCMKGWRYMVVAVYGKLNLPCIFSLTLRLALRFETERMKLSPALSQPPDKGPTVKVPGPPAGVLQPKLPAKLPLQRRPEFCPSIKLPTASASRNKPRQHRQPPVNCRPQTIHGARWPRETSRFSTRRRDSI